MGLTVARWGIAITLVLVPLSAQTVLINENFSGGLPSGFHILGGAVQVDNGFLNITSQGCVQLPGPGTNGTFSRAGGLSIEMDIRITDQWGFAAVWGFYPSAVCGTNSSLDGIDNGYYTFWPSVINDGVSHHIGVAVNGQGTPLASSPVRLVSGRWTHVAQEYLPDGTINTYVDGTKTMSTQNAAFSDGFFALVGHSSVDFDNLVVRTINTTSSCALTCAATVPASGIAFNTLSFAGAAAATSCSASITYDWTFGDGPTHSTQQSPTHAYSTAGSYTWGMTTNAGTASCTKTGTISIGPQPSVTPTFSAAGVVNAASSQPGMVPGSLATIYGTNLATGVFQAQTTPWPTTLGTTRVLVGGVLAPVYYVGPGQINFQVPWEAAGGNGATVVVMNNGATSQGINVPVIAAQPGVFMLNATQAAILRIDGSVVSPTNPARAGEVIILYATGVGAVDHRPQTGQPAPSAEPLSRNAQTSATLGPPADVQYAGLAGGYIGLYQLNLRVPDNAPSGTMNLVITSAGYISPTYQLSVVRSDGTSYVETFQGTHSQWHVANHDGPGGITRSDNVLFPNAPGQLGACGPSRTTVTDLAIIVPSTGCPAAYTNGGTGGQLQTTNNIHFGYYEITVQASQAAGAVNSLFLYLSDSNEIDIELLSKQNTQSSGFVNFSVHLPNARTVTSIIALPFAPWSGYHRYGFDWQPAGITWYIDGQRVTLGTASRSSINGAPATIGGCTTTVSQGTGNNATTVTVDNPGCFTGAVNVPQLPGLLIVNNWSNGQEWSGPLPMTDALMTVRNVMLAPSAAQQ